MRVIGIDPGTAIVGYGIIDFKDNEIFITEPHQATPDQTNKYFMFALFWHRWASDRRCEAFVTTNRKDFSSTGSISRVEL